MAFNGFSTKAGLFEEFINTASSFDLRDFFQNWFLNMTQQCLFFSDVITESEDDEGITLSILPVTDDIVFFRILYQNIAG